MNYRQRVLVANVNPALMGANGVSADNHALDHRVRVALHDRAVLECARVALVAVAQHESPLSRCVLARLPLACSRKPGAAATALARRRHLADDLVRRHLMEGFGQPRVGALCNGVEDAGGIDAADVAHRHPHLVLVKRDLVVLDDPLAADRLLVEEVLNYFAADQGLLDDLLDAVRFDLGVENPRRLQHHQRPALAETVAAG
jgi:hypothetical protein